MTTVDMMCRHDLGWGDDMDVVGGVGRRLFVDGSSALYECRGWGIKKLRAFEGVMRSFDMPLQEPDQKKNGSIKWSPT